MERGRKKSWDIWQVMTDDKWCMRLISQTWTKCQFLLQLMHRMLEKENHTTRRAWMLKNCVGYKLNMKFHYERWQLVWILCLIFTKQLQVCRWVFNKINLHRYDGKNDLFPCRWRHGRLSFFYRMWISKKFELLRFLLASKQRIFVAGA